MERQKTMRFDARYEQYATARAKPCPKCWRHELRVHEIDLGQEHAPVVWRFAYISKTDIFDHGFLDGRSSYAARRHLAKAYRLRQVLLSERQALATWLDRDIRFLVIAKVVGDIIERSSHCRNQGCGARSAIAVAARQVEWEVMAPARSLESRTSHARARGRLSVNEIIDNAPSNSNTMDMARKSTFTEQLVQAIETSGKSRYAIGKATGVDPAVLCHFVQGNRGMSLGSVDALCEYLNLELVKRDRPANPKSGRK